MSHPILGPLRRPDVWFCDPRDNCPWCADTAEEQLAPLAHRVAFALATRWGRVMAIAVFSVLFVGCAPCSTRDVAPCDGDAYGALVTTQLDTSERLGCEIAPSCTLATEPSGLWWTSCFKAAHDSRDCDELWVAVENCGGVP